MPDNNNVIEQIKDKIDIIDIISEHVALKKNGRNYIGLCPFHKEKTPSFSVNHEKGIFKCFGCGASGDAISFLMQINHQSFMQVMEELAYKYGIEWKVQGQNSNSNEISKIKKEIIKANALTVEFYQNCLQNNKDAKAYLEKRYCTDEIIKRFGLGFSPDKPNDLYNYLLQKGFNADLLLKAGLISEKTDKSGYLDKFRGRIIVPIFNERGEAVAFGARIFLSDNGPKYLNSQETLVYNKSKTLYGLYQAKDFIKEEDAVVIMEGYFDVITAHANGIQNAVASCGTSLTEQHVKILNRYMDNKRIFLAFDSDSAGVKATKRNAQIIKEELEPLGIIKQFDTSFANVSLKDEYACEIRVVTTNSGKDPDEFIKENGAEAYKNCIANATLLLDYQINSIIDSAPKKLSAQEKTAIIKEVSPILAEVNNRIVFDEYVKKLSLRLSIDKNTLNQEIKKLQSGKKFSVEEKKPIVTISSNKLIICQKNLLSLYFISGDNIPFSWLSQKLSEVEFKETNLVSIKETIDEFIKETNSTETLTEKLMDYFSQNPEIKSDLVDIIYSTEDKSELLNQGLIEEFVDENIKNIKKISKENETKKLIETAQQFDDNDERAAKIQQEILEKIKQKRQLEYKRLE